MASKNNRRGSARKERRISIRGVKHEQPDVRKLARALIAIAQAEAEAQAQHQAAQEQQSSKEVA